jgi:hypothetical protein
MASYINMTPAEQIKLRQERQELRRIADWRNALNVDYRESAAHEEPLHDSRAMRDWYLAYNRMSVGVLV